jgi:hypothetical protein
VRQHQGGLLLQARHQPLVLLLTRKHSSSKQTYGTPLEQLAGVLSLLLQEAARPQQQQHNSSSSPSSSSRLSCRLLSALVLHLAACGTLRCQRRLLVHCMSCISLAR